jgi:hypothetical protein
MGRPMVLPATSFLKKTHYSKISVKYTNIFHFTTCNLKLLEMRLCNIILLVTSYKTNIITNKMIVQRGPGD